jgi:hypothetical protein
MQEDINMQSLFSTQVKQLLLVTILLALPTLGMSGNNPGDLAVTPASIVMGAQYNGLDLKVNGTVPANSEVIVRLIGAPSELHLREKGKVFGLLWMNVGKVTLNNVPRVCLINASSPLETLGQVATPFRLEALAKAVGIEKDGGGTSIDIPHQLLLLKTKEKLYGESAQGVTLGPNEGDMRTFTAVIKVPSALAPGEYQVEAIAVHGDAVTGRSTVTVKAALSGFPKWLSELAFQKSLLYGVLATVIAIFSGLAIGLVFQSKGAH